MDTGAVYRWETDKAKGYASREKLHVYICTQAVPLPNILLFICSDGYPTDFSLLRRDHNHRNFLKQDSVISCSSPVFYHDHELRSYSISKVGRLVKATLRSLHDHIANHDVMEGRYIRQICAALGPMIK